MKGGSRSGANPVSGEGSQKAQPGLPASPGFGNHHDAAGQRDSPAQLLRRTASLRLGRQQQRPTRSSSSASIQKAQTGPRNFWRSVSRAAAQPASTSATETRTASAAPVGTQKEDKLPEADNTLVTGNQDFVPSQRGIRRAMPMEIVNRIADALTLSCGRGNRSSIKISRLQADLQFSGDTTRVQFDLQGLRIRSVPCANDLGNTAEHQVHGSDNVANVPEPLVGCSLAKGSAAGNEVALDDEPPAQVEDLEIHDDTPGTATGREGLGTDFPTCGGNCSNVNHSDEEEVHRGNVASVRRTTGSGPAVSHSACNDAACFDKTRVSAMKSPSDPGKRKKIEGIITLSSCREQSETLASCSIPDSGTQLMSSAIKTPQPITVSGGTLLAQGLTSEEKCDGEDVDQERERPCLEGCLGSAPSVSETSATQGPSGHGTGLKGDPEEEPLHPVVHKVLSTDADDGKIENVAAADLCTTSSGQKCRSQGEDCNDHDVASHCTQDVSSSTLNTVPNGSSKSTKSNTGNIRSSRMYTNTSFTPSHGRFFVSSAIRTTHPVKIDWDSGIRQRIVGNVCEQSTADQSAVAGFGVQKSMKSLRATPDIRDGSKRARIDDENSTHVANQGEAGGSGTLQRQLYRGREVTIFDCLNCLDFRPVKESFTCTSCDHRICKSCIVKQASHQGRTSRGPIRCVICGDVADVEEIVRILDKEADGYDILIQKIFSSNFYENLRYCSNSKCSEPFDWEEANSSRCSQAENNRVECPFCLCHTCASCRSKWHEGLTCEQHQSLQSKDVVNIVKEKKDWKQCPDCKNLIERSSGCKEMQCLCGCMFCYECGKKRCDCEFVLSDDPDYHEPIRRRRCAHRR